MLKAVLNGTKHGEPNQTIFLGITKENVAALIEGRPILVDGKELGMPGKDIAIHYGKDIAEITDDLRKAGLPL